MPKSLPAQCRYCPKRRVDGHYVSRNGLCHECAMKRVEAVVGKGAEAQARAADEAVGIFRPAS